MQPTEAACFEFRIFGNALGQSLEQLLPPVADVPVEKQTDIYLLAANTTVNLKIRDNRLKSKVLMRYQQGLERWHPHLDLAFPLTAPFLEEMLFPWLAVAPPPLQSQHYTVPALLDLVADVPALQAVRVHKQRRHLQVDDCQVEVATLYVANHFYTRSVALEAVDPLVVQRLRARLGLLDEENVNYIQGLTALLKAHPVLADVAPTPVFSPMPQATFARVGW